MDSGRRAIRGFTLVELLISIAIIFLLSAIALPTYLKYKNRAVVSYVQQNLVNCASSLMAEYADNGINSTNCTIKDSTNSCELVVSNNGDYIKIANSYCIFEVKGIKVKCEIITNYGDVNGRVECYQISQ